MTAILLSCHLILLVVLGSTCLAPAGTITGTARIKETNAGLSGVSIQTFSLSGGSGFATTDAQGNYVISNLSNGDYILYGRRSGYGTDFLDAIKVTDSETVAAPDLRLTNNPGRVEGSVTFNGAPLEGIIVEVLVRTNPSSGWSVLNFTTSSSQAGINYILPELSEGLSYDVRALGGEVGGTRYAPVAQRDVAASDGTATRIDFAIQEAPRVHGKVTDGSNPLPGVVVTLGARDFSSSTVTDADGNYEVFGSADLSQQLTVDPPDESNYVQQVLQLTNLNSGDRREDFVLPGGALMVSGTVTDAATGQLVPGLHVFSWNYELEFGVSSVTASDGTYALFNLPPGSTQIRVRPESGFAQDGIDIDLSQDTTGLSFALIPPALLEGTVRDRETQDAIPGVKVAYLNKGAPIYLDTFTDSSGKFSFKTVREGAVTLRVEPDPNQTYGGRFYAGREVDLTMSRGDKVTSFPLRIYEGALVSGDVRDHLANPMPNHEVYVSQGSGEEIGEFRTDAAGHYALRLPPGRHTIALDTEESAWTALPMGIELASPSDERTVNLTAFDSASGAKLRGQVANPDGHAVHPGTFLGLVAVPAPFMPITLENYYLLETVGFAGLQDFGDDYELTIPPDQEYSVVFFLQQGESILIRGNRAAHPTGGEPILDGLDFTYDSEGGTISGSVTLDGALLPSAEVLLFTAAGDFTGFAEVGPSGTYVFRNVPPGSYELRALHPEFGTSSPGTITAFSNGETRSEIVLAMSIAVQELQSVVRPSGRFEIGFNAASDSEYLVQVSQDLQRWVTVATVHGQGALLSWMDLHATEAEKFYRVVLNE